MITLIACLSLMIACSAPESTEQNDDAEEQTLKEGTSNTEEKKEKKRKEKRERQKEEEVAEVNNEDIALFEVNDIEDLKIQEKKVDNLYDDEGNFQIGRASCRERVEIWVGGGAEKKKE